MIKINPLFENINWLNKDSYFFTHCKKDNILDESVFEKLSLKGHIFILTSGSKERKCVCLSKDSFLTSSQAVNHHLQASSKDIWTVALPLFHVGGLSILARSFLLGSKITFFHKKWNALDFISHIKEKKTTLTSLIPTQLYDLLQVEGISPPHLRAVLIGGERLNENLYKKARKQGWPILPTYGLTEACSQVATSDLLSLEKMQIPSLKVLNHCRVQIKNERIWIQSSSLLTGWFSIEGLKEKSVKSIVFNKMDKHGWFETEDNGVLEGKTLTVYGKKNNVKILGENVSLYNLNEILMNILIQLEIPYRYILLSHPHPRKSHEIVLVSDYENLEVLSQVKNKINERVLSYERIEKCYLIPYLPKGSLGKMSLTLLMKKLGLRV